jgi:hypothetical protein
MHLEYQRLLREFPDLAERLDALPGRVFSGKEHPTPGTKAVFVCYRLPRPVVVQASRLSEDAAGTAAPQDTPWTEEAGETRWYLYHLEKQAILEEPSVIVEAIRCAPETPRRCVIEQATLSEIRGKIEKHRGGRRSRDARQGL